MKRNLSIAISIAGGVALLFASLALAADPPAYVVFTTDAPCSVSDAPIVQVLSYTNPANQPGPIVSKSTIPPGTLDTYPFTSVVFVYPASVTCGGTIYNLISISPGDPVSSRAAGTTTTVTGHYVPDTTPPVWTVPADFNVEATGPAGAIVTYNASASDPDDAVVSQACTPTSGSTFPLGTTTVNCTATDTHGNVGIASFNVTVEDTTPPTLTLPSNMTVSASSASGAVASFSASANDLVDGNIAITCVPPSGSSFPIGQTTVNCSAIDAHGNGASGSFTVTVVDNVPPVLTLPSNITVIAPNASGAVVNFTVSATDAVDGPVAVTCSPISGSLFPVGQTTVSCSASDSHGNTGTGSFIVTVILDDVPPVLTLPANMTVSAQNASGAVVTFTASANDAVDGVVPVTCTPASGSLFPIGQATVNCSATDAHGNTSSGSFTVTVVDDIPPVLTIPSDITVSAQNASGAVVSFTVSATDAVDGVVPVTCTPASGSLFPLGQTTVNCSASDSNGNTGTGSFKVNVVDDLPPVLTLPSDITVIAPNTSGAVVNFTASAIDAVDGPVAVTCSPASGSLFPLGQTTVNCSASDSHGNTANGSFTVTVTLDNIPPVLTLPSDITASAQSADGAIVNFTVSAIDAVDGPVPATCTPASGSLFPIGQTMVNCSASDSKGNTANGSFTITVVDNIPPMLTLPANITVTAQNASGAVVNFTASATDAVTGPVPVACIPASGSLFPIGQTTVNCSANDAQGNTANGSFIVSVQYAAAGNKCKGVAGHEILQPINTNGSSVFKQGSTVPAKFRVCGADGDPIGTPGVVTRFRLIGVISDGTLSNVDEAVLSTPPDTEFRSGNQQWIFNIDTKNLFADHTYIYLITLNDGSTIQFQFTLK